MMPLPVHWRTAPQRLVFPDLQNLHSPQNACSVAQGGHYMTDNTVPL